jgi:hypothetical protein
MKPIHSVLAASQLLRRYLRKDWLASALILTALLAVELIALYLLPQRPSGLPRARSPVWVITLQILISIIQDALVLGFAVRAYAWLTVGAPLSLRATLKQAYRYFGALIVVTIAIFIYYLAVPTVAITVSLFIWPHWYGRGSPWPSLIYFPFAAYAAFGTAYILPILLQEQARAFHNIREALKLSVAVAPTTLLVAAPWPIGNALRPIGDALGWQNSMVTLIYQALLLVTLVFGFFAYAVTKNLSPYEIDKAA